MESNHSSSSIGLNLLQVAFIVLKLCKVIDWSWWWVLAPIWIPIIIIAVTFIVILSDPNKRRLRRMRRRKENPNEHI